MIPLVATVHVRIKERFLRLWIPLFLAWLLLLPVMLLLLPLFFIGCGFIRINPFRLLSYFWRIVSGLPGTHVEFQDRNAAFLMRIS